MKIKRISLKAVSILMMKGIWPHRSFVYLSLHSDHFFAKCSQRERGYFYTLVYSLVACKEIVN